MITDVITIARKELKEIFVQRGSLRSGMTNLLIVIGIIGILFPLQMGTEWITSPLGLISAAWLPMFMSMGLVADAFAGERERHTLETLLASRLSDQAILFGKMAASVLYALGITVVGMLLGAITVNLAHPGTGFYPAGSMAGAILFSLLGALLVTGAGVLVSLHANNVRQAYQRMSLAFLVLWLPLILGPQLLPEEWQIQIAQAIQRLNPLQILIGLGIGLLVVDAGLILLAINRFQRSRLILD
jgi:ABC-2 type transport system permease protein